MTLLEALKKIKENPDKRRGICFNLFYLIAELSDKEFRDTDESLKSLFKQWPDHHRKGDGSLDLDFPVGGYMEFTKQSCDGTLWQNPKRIALLDWCIQTLEKEKCLSNKN